MKNLIRALTITTISALLTPLAHAAPFDIVQCMTISQAGSYRLAGNLQSGLGDCLVVLTDNVSIDLAGFTIRGRSRGAGPATRDPREAGFRCTAHIRAPAHPPSGGLRQPYRMPRCTRSPEHPAIQHPR